MMCKKKIIILMVFICISVITNLSAQTRTITVVCEDRTEFPSILGEGTEIQWNKPGISVDVLKSMERELGVQFEFIRQPWSRCLESLKRGSADALFIASYKKEREEYGIYPMHNGEPDPLLRMTATSYAFYIMKNGKEFPWDGSTLGNLNGQIGAPRGYSIVSDLQNMGAAVVESPSTLIDFKKLSAGRLIAVAALEDTADFILSKNPELARQIEKVPPLIVNKPYYLMFSHNFYSTNKSVADSIWNKLSLIRETGQYSALLSRYFE